MLVIVALIIIGFLAGMLGGVLGIGGGIVLMPVLRFFVGLSPSAAAGTCIVAVFFTTLGGTLRHYKLGHVHIKSILPVIAFGVITTVTFSIFFPSFVKNQTWLDLGTGLIFSLVAGRMVAEAIAELRGNKPNKRQESQVRGLLLKKVSIGTLAGILPGLLGIGTGAVLVPAFVFALGAPMKIAIGSSLTCFCVNAFISSAFKLFQGYTVVSVALPLCLGTLLGSNIGAILNKRFPSPVLKLLFGTTFLYVSFKYVFFFFGKQI